MDMRQLGISSILIWVANVEQPLGYIDVLCSKQAFELIAVRRKNQAQARYR